MTSQSPSATARASYGRRSLFLAALSGRDFRLFFGGQIISLLGDSFTAVALPWLVMQLSEDPEALGSLMALLSAPRGVFMLLAGPLVDRFTARTVLLAANLCRMLVAASLGLLVLSGEAELWMLYPLALISGTAAGFVFPAQAAIVPRLVEPAQLRVANTLIDGAFAISLIAGPALAASVIALGGGAITVAGPATASGSQGGLALAFAVNALTFAVSLATLWLIRSGARETAGPAMPGSLWESLRDGLAYVWRDRPLCVFVGAVAAMAFASVGPISVGLPVLVERRLTGGTTSFGIILSGYGGGTLVGLVLAGVLPKPPPRFFALATCAIAGLTGLGIAVSGSLGQVVPVAAVLSVVGVGQGYVNILVMTWLQWRTPKKFLGRLMSVFMFSQAGLMPVAQAIAGPLLALDVTTYFLCAGALTALVMAVTASLPSIRRLGLETKAMP